MKKLFPILLSCALAACGYDDFGERTLADIPIVETLPNADIALLYTNYRGEPFTIKENMVLEGYIIADDSSGNFFRSFVIDDGTAAVEICAGYYDLHNLYPVGRRIAVHAEGLAVGMYNGVIQIGVRINEYTPYRIEEFGVRAVLEKYVERDMVLREPVPLRVELSELESGLCGRLVKTGNILRISESPEYWAQSGSEGGTVQSGTVVFRDGRGDSLAVVTSGYASFAAGRVPADSVSLTGILMYGKFGGTRERFVLKLRDECDVQR